MSVTLKINGAFACSGSEPTIWPVQVGAQPPEVGLLVHADLDSKLEALANPISLEIGGDFTRGTAAKTFKDSMRGLYLTRREGIEGGHRVRWFITDTRAYLSKLWVFADFSIRRPLNEFNRVGVGPQKDFNQTPKLGYIPHTNRDLGSDDKDPRFAAGNTAPEKHKPWTAKQAILYLLKGWFDTQPDDILPDRSGWRPVVDDQAPDNGRLLVDFRANRPWPRVMDALLRIARVILYVSPDGSYVLRSADPVSLEGLGGYEGGGTPIKQGAARLRPRRTRVYFRTERELRFNFYESTDVTSTGSVERGTRDVSLTLENVLILPQDVKESSTGKIYQRGTVVPIVKALELWNQDPDNPAPKKLTSKGAVAGDLKLSLDFIRKHIMSPALATQMTFNPRAFQRDSIFSARAATLYQSYRQLFRIPPVWLDLVERMRFDRTAISDPVTGKRAPTPIWMDYFTELSARWFMRKGVADPRAGFNTKAWKGALEDIIDFEKLPLDQGEVAPFLASWVNKRQGVFKVSGLPDLQGFSQRYIPAVFDPQEIPVAYGGSGFKVYQLQQMKYRENWRMSLIITAMLRTPNTASKLYSVDFGPVESDASGPNHEVLFGMTHAGFAWLDRDQVNKRGKVEAGRSRVKIDGNDVKIEGGVLTNKAVIDDAAKAVFEQVKFDHADRWLGSYATPGWDATRQPVGQISSASLVHRSGRVETVYRAETPPVTPGLWELLPQETQNFLFRIEGAPAP